jgi:hypothetical protein
LRFIPHVLVRFLLRHWGRFFSKPRWAQGPEPQIGGKASFSGMYPWGITDMRCCQLAAAVAHLLPVLNSLFVFCGPKTGARFWIQKWGHNTKIGSSASKFVAPIWAHGICVLPSAKSALCCDRLHLSFMFSCAWCQDAVFSQ